MRMVGRIEASCSQLIFFLLEYLRDIPPCDLHWKLKYTDSARSCNEKQMRQIRSSSATPLDCSLVDVDMHASSKLEHTDSARCCDKRQMRHICSHPPSPAGVCLRLDVGLHASSSDLHVAGYITEFAQNLARSRFMAQRHLSTNKSFVMSKMKQF